MKFKTGDKVKFLNETGGGIVSKIVSGSLVYVTTEDGFDLPVSTSDIIKINPETRAEKMFDQDFDIKPGTSSAAPVTDPAPAKTRVRKSAEEPAGYYLAFVPADQQWFISGNIEVRLINHTDHDILYNFLLRDEEGEYFGFDYGSVEAGSSSEIDSIEREALPGWTDGIVQIIPHSEEEAFLPLQCGFHIKAGKFSSEGSYQDSGLFNDKAIVFRLAEAKMARKVSGKKDVVKEEEPVEIKASLQKKETLIGKHATGPHAAVVDLHIGELVDNIAGMNSHDMFLLQMNYFERALNSAMENNFKKITFIHGVGNGVLKNAIIERLKDFEGTENKQASLAEYGNGALDVIVHHK